MHSRRFKQEAADYLRMATVELNRGDIQRRHEYMMNSRVAQRVYETIVDIRDELVN